MEKHELDMGAIPISSTLLPSEVSETKMIFVSERRKVTTGKYPL
jgi:hypothetical protein